MTKRILLTLAFAVAILALFGTGDAHSNSSSPPAGNSSAPGQSSCGGSSCHSTATNTGGGNVSISLGDGLSEYMPGQTYDMTVTINDPDAMRYGFEMVAFDLTNSSIGQFGLSGDAFVDVRDIGGINYVNHKFVTIGNPNTFEFTWTAPAALAGNVSFYVAANAADGSGNAGDKIYTASLTIEGVMNTGIEEDILATTLYPNPAIDYVTLKWDNFNRPETVQIFDLQGKLQTQSLISTAKTSIFIGDLLPGVYLMQNEQASWQKKLFVQ